MILFVCGPCHRPRILLPSLPYPFPCRRDWRSKVTVVTVVISYNPPSSHTSRLLWPGGTSLHSHLHLGCLLVGRKVINITSSHELEASHHGQIVFSGCTWETVDQRGQQSPARRHRVPKGMWRCSGKCGPWPSLQLLPPLVGTAPILPCSAEIWDVVFCFCCWD